MSRTKIYKRIGSLEWWGKRPLAGHFVSRRSKTNKFFKRLLHKKERKNFNIIKEDLKY